MPSYLWRRIAVLLILLLVLYVLVPQIHTFSASLSMVRAAHPRYVALGLLATAGTYLAAALVYWLLAKHAVRYGRTLLVQISSAFVNRLLPAGVGGMGLNVRYLHTVHHSVSEAVAVVGTNNSLGIVGNGILLLLALATSGDMVRHLQLPHAGVWGYGVLAAIAIAMLNLFVSRRLRRFLTHALGEVWRHVRSYSKHPFRFVAALGGALSVTILHVIVLWCCSRAIGVPLSAQTALAVLSVGMLVGTATPTPGGLGGVEAGLVGGLVAYGITASDALAVALLYRLLTYWLPLVPGVVAFILLRRRLLDSSADALHRRS
jgi:uncharacterized membrane protein YbhN (UPF0104 family)